MKNLRLMLFLCFAAVVCVVQAWFPKMCRPQKLLHCWQCDNDDDPLCETSKIRQCDEDALNQSLARLNRVVGVVSMLGNETFCYVRRFQRYGRISFIVRGCGRVTKYAIKEDIPLHELGVGWDPCKCTRHLCNGYKVPPYPKSLMPESYYSLPYAYPPSGKGTDSIQCGAEEGEEKIIY